MSDEVLPDEIPGDDVPEPPEGYHNQPQHPIPVDEDENVEYDADDDE